MKGAPDALPTHPTRSTGQDQNAVIKRQLQHLLPSIRAFLDVDDLVEIGNLEEYIRESACVQFFLSKGYFQSRNCLREVRSTVMHMKPIILCHEADPAKGGLKLKESSNECLPELRPFVFTTVEYQVHWGTGKMTRKEAGHDTVPPDRQVITWMRVKEFQLLSLKLICSKLLHISPYYKNLAVLQNERRPSIHEEPSGSRQMSSRLVPRHARRLLKRSASKVDELQTLYIPSEVLSLDLSFEHRKEPVKLIIIEHNEGAYDFGKEMVRAFTGVTLIAELHSGLRGLEEVSHGFIPGARVVHLKHGLGCVYGWTMDGRLRVIFDEGSSHAYRLKTIQDKLRPAPDSAPPPPQGVTLGPHRRPSCGHGLHLEKLAHNLRDMEHNMANRMQHMAARVHHGHHGSANREHSDAKAKRPRRSSVSRDPKSEEEELKLLLYLNEHTWDAEAGQEVAEVVRAAWSKGVEIIMVHETDPDRDGCEFAHMFAGTTPQDLIDEGIYKSIALALHPMPHREVSLALVAQACGAVPRNTKHMSALEKKHHKKNNTASTKYRNKHRQKQQAWSPPPSPGRTKATRSQSWP